MAYNARGWGGTNDDDGDHSCNDPRNNAAMAPTPARVVFVFFILI